MKKKHASPLGVLRWIAMGICVVIMVICAVYLIRLALESRQVQQNTQQAATQFTHQVEPAAGDSGGDNSEQTGESGLQAPDFSVDFAALQASCPDAVGWIRIAGLDVVDYPVVQGSDDSYYLDHAWDGASSRYGAIFLESENAGDFSDCYSLIYGHNMKNGSMFGSLKKYAKEDFFRENGGAIYLCLPGETRIYQIFSVHYVSADDEGVYTIGFQQDDSFAAYVSAMKQASVYDTGVEVSGQDSVITLSTCAGEDRLVVHAKLAASFPTE